MIRLEHISKTFHPGEAPEIKALDDLNLNIAAGEYLVVVGANGSGKSTLLNLLAGTYPPDRGELYIGTEAIGHKAEHERSRYMARLFQNPLTGTAPELSILENFRLAALRTSSKKLRIGIDAQFRQSVASSIARLGMGLENKLAQPMGQLSGGQRQALTLLMSVQADCQLLLMDEPTSALDPRNAELVMELADTLIREKALTAILVTHRLKDCVQYGSRLILLQEGRIAKDLSAAEKQQVTLPEIYNWFSGA
ncbi:MAG: ATP-binding cassette domain-containing protein [Bacteroidia bacterium]|nr:ATP-binding cassette domain-containing protein [Bacteroidia bacterium]